MEINNSKEDISQKEICSLSHLISSLSSEDQNELNPLQEIFRSHSSEPKDDVTKNIDQRDKRDHCNKSNRATKRYRSMEYRVMMEKKRRQLIRDKVDILQAMTPYCAKSDLATKLEGIVEYMKSLKHQRDIMSKAYTESAGYMSPFYAAQAPCMAPPYTTPWCYYAPGIPMMPHQNIPFNPLFRQTHDKAPPDLTQ
ncbi:hypothetical protein EUTSA_v10019164mg [Eutrema salsugineum]|uniref:BHLH domain-containing protein n=1 Tax=Eutrema salsugineum TaxID=72664 RepID=V4JT02_EUTSA|nr:hypothetical protein EUTSA_v10019164mg [Eutrema salsugineum]